MSPTRLDDATPEDDEHAAKAVAVDPHLLRARRTAATARAVLGALGIVLALGYPALSVHPVQVAIGFCAVLSTALLRLTAPRVSLVRLEELIAGVAAVAIIGLEDERVTILTLVWLAAIASGILARGGRVHWTGRTAVLTAFALPLIRLQQARPEYGALFLATVGLLITAGGLTRELNSLLLQARHDADHDDLTGLLSRAAFRGALDRAAAKASRGRPVSLLMLDLDGFGKVNKTLGHTAGDALLGSVGRTLRERAGQGCRVGRLGGDEFAIIAQGANPKALADDLLAGLAACRVEARALSACIGIAQAPSDGEDSEALLMAVDIALRIAKRGGGAQITSYAGESLSGEGRRSARNALAKLIGGEGLAIAVQPIVDIRTGEVHAYEALARFGGSKQSPLHWLSVAEELGQRAELERACLREALKLLPERPPGTRLSVNLSGPVLLDASTIAMFEEATDLSGLIVEITEQALVASEDKFDAALAPLRERGAALAVDDMGAGYSGLRQLTVVHPQYLKLDRSLVTGIEADGDRAALIAALIGYADRVGSMLVAEGIEEETELHTLLDLGVTLGQGYFFSRPGRPWPLRDAVPDAALPIKASKDQRIADRRGADRRKVASTPAAAVPPASTPPTVSA